MLSIPATWEIAPGLTDYELAISLMRERIAAIRGASAPELLWLLEHPPLYTAGTSAAESDLQDSSRFPTYNAGRGGQWTYHGPGQRVVYAMLDLNNPHGTVPARDIRAYVVGLELWVIATLKEFGIKGETRAGRVRHLDREWGQGGQDLRHRRADKPLGDLARPGAERAPGSVAFQRHHPLRDSRARRHQPGGPRGKCHDGRGQFGAPEEF